MSFAIRTHDVGKRYRIGQNQSYGALRDSIARAFTAPRRLFRGRREAAERSDDIIWALRNLSFQVDHGEVIGIIGRNGSGKSTLLKILSRITEPTEGYAEVRGRVGSLLEVGTGFHGELSGRENVFVNGAILGMRKKDIERRFDEIVAFADVERFIDTPIKHYSSGMQLRLAFAVAAHLEPEILLVDEVLAVGDLAFQQKCLGKMDEVRRHGRTVLFVSHQMNQVRRLCQQCLWLDRGKTVAVGPTMDIMAKYESALLSASDNERSAEARSAPAYFEGWDLQAGDAAPTHVLKTAGPVVVRFHMWLNAPMRYGSHAVALHDSDGRLVWGTGVERLSLEPGAHAITYAFDSIPLRPGPYRWHVTIYEDQGLLDSYHGVPEMIVATVPMGHWRDEAAGVLNLPYRLTVDQTQQSETDAADALGAGPVRIAR